MSTSFTMTARDMVTQAMREIGVLASGEQPTAEEMADGMFRLNSLLKSYAAKGLNLWRDTDGTAVFAAGQAFRAIPAAVSISNVRAQSTTDRVLGEWELDDYRAIPNKAATGSPVAYAVATGAPGLTLYLWPAPAVETTIAYSYARLTQDATESAAIDVPQMFQEAIWTMLAVRLAPIFGKARADPQTVQVIAMRAAELERDMLDWDRPESYLMGPDLDRYP